MRLHVLQLDLGRSSETHERTDLVYDEVVGLLRRHVHRPAAEADEVLEARMRADGDTALFGARDASSA